MERLRVFLERSELFFKNLFRIGVILVLVWTAGIIRDIERQIPTDREVERVGSYVKEVRGELNDVVFKLDGIRSAIILTAR